MLEAVRLDAIEQAVGLKAYVEANHRGMQTAVLSVFAGVNSMRILAYVLQFLKAVKDTNGASAISFATWGLFLASNITTILYALICLGDPLMALIFLGNAFACSAILVATYLKRRSYRRSFAPTPAE